MITNELIPIMVTIPEAAKQTGLAVYHIQRLCSQNEIVYITTGKKHLINLDKLIEYLNTGKTEHTQVFDKIRPIRL